MVVSEGAGNGHAYHSIGRPSGWAAGLACPAGIAGTAPTGGAVWAGSGEDIFRVFPEYDSE